MSKCPGELVAVLGSQEPCSGLGRIPQSPTVTPTRGGPQNAPAGAELQDWAPHQASSASSLCRGPSGLHGHEQNLQTSHHCSMSTPPKVPEPSSVPLGDLMSTQQRVWRMSCRVQAGSRTWLSLVGPRVVTTAALVRGHLPFHLAPR